MEKQYGTSNGHSKWTHPVYCNTHRTSQPQAGASEPRAGGTPHIAFAENSFLNEGKWVSRESFQGAGFLIVSVPIHDP
jgi:hypothetical protein